MKKIELSDKNYEHLRNILIWAELYDLTRNSSKNKILFSSIKKDWDYQIEEKVNEK